MIKLKNMTNRSNDYEIFTTLLAKLQKFPNENKHNSSQLE